MERDEAACLVQDTDLAISYLCENLTVFEKNRLENLLGGRTISEILMVGCRREGSKYGLRFAEEILGPLVHLCYMHIKAKPEAPREVYSLLAKYWHLNKDISLEETISLLEEGLEYHEKDILFHGDLFLLRSFCPKMER